MIQRCAMCMHRGSYVLEERAAVGLVSAAHFFSHFYLLVIPFLFLSIQAEMGLSFTQLGLITALYAAGSAGGQFIMGIYVDRHGPRWFLILGLLTVALAYIAMGMATAYWMLLVLGFVAGLGDSVFHPADFSKTCLKLLKNVFQAS